MLAPEVTFNGAELVQSPIASQLQAHYCPQLLKDQGSFLSAASGLICQQAFGAPPTESELAFAFDLRFSVANPNKLPLPVASLLTAIRVFPEGANADLGAVCLNVCGPDDVSCQQGVGCEQPATDISDAEEIKQAMGHLLFAEGIRMATQGDIGFRLPPVAAHERVDLVARFSLPPQDVLPLLKALAEQSIDQFKKGESVSFEIPYKLAGTVFADGGSFGILSAPWGPTDGSFPVPVTE